MRRINPSWPVVLPMMLALFVQVQAHVTENSGQRLQLYSYYTESPPVINACLTDASTAAGTVGTQGIDNDEWRDAAVRKIPIQTDGAETTDLNLFLMNDADYLYVGVSSNFNNFGNNTTVRLFFDQGSAGGNHNDILDGGGTGVNNGEYRCDITTNSQNPTEYSFNGTSWSTQTPNQFNALAYNFGNALLQAEFRIPLNGNPSTDDTHSYLDVTGTQELGLNFNIYTTNDGGMTFYWHATNGSTTDAATSPGWTDVRLGVERKYVTFYPTYNANGIPSVDGAITEDAWRGCFRRDIVLTNFSGSMINATMYAVEDNTNNDIYIGMRITDNDNNAGDFCEIYQEQDNATPATGRNYLLDGGIENALIADENPYGAGDDRYWNSTSDSWAADASTANQSALGTWSSDHYDYEFRIVQDAGGNDLDVADNGVFGFLIRYHDAADNTDYFWDYSPNADNIQIDENGSVYVATGWPDMQLGSPYVQVIFPVDNANVEGIMNIRIYAQDENADGIDSAHFYRASTPGSKYELTRIGSTNEFSGSFDVASLANGPDTLVIAVGDDDGVVSQRLVHLNIANGSGAASPPTIALTSPSPGTEVGGAVAIAFTAVANGGATVSATDISIDGGSYGATATISTHSWNTSALPDGSHTIRLRVTDSNGAAAYSEITTYVIINSPSVMIASPAADTTVRDSVTVTFTATPVAPATIATTEASLDGGAWTGTTTSSTVLLPTGPLTDGAHTLQIRVTDNAGRTGYSGTLKFNSSNAPTVSLTAPAADTVVSENMAISFTVSVIGSATHASSAFSIDGGTWTSTSSLTSHTFDTRSLTNGSHIVQIRATDSNGETGLSSIIKFSVSNGPSVSITAPEPDSIVAGVLVATFSPTTTAPTTIDSVLVSVDGEAWKIASGATSDSIDTRQLNEGDHILQVRVVDANGKSAVSSIVKFVVNNTPVVAITAPAETLTISGIDTVRFTVAYAPGADRDTTEVSIDGGAWRPTTGALSHTWITTDYADGNHTVQIRATGDNGKTGYSIIRTFRVDNKPRTAIVAPVAGSTVTGIDTVVLTATAVYPAVITGRELSIDGGDFFDTLYDSTRYLLNTTTLADGSHSIQSRVTDNKGRTALSNQVLFITRNSPSVTINLPLAGDTLAGTIDITFSAEAVSPAVIESTFISVDGGPWETTATDSTAQINSTTLADGSHIFRIKAVDSMKKQEESTDRLFIVDNAPPLITVPTVSYPDKADYARENAQVAISVLVKDLVSGLRSDSAITLNVPGSDEATTTLVMTDQGDDGDRVADDNVFSALFTIGTDTTGTIPYVITATDNLGNTDSITGVISLDNTAPATGFTLKIVDRDSTINSSSVIFYDRLRLEGTYTDEGGSGLSRVYISLVNDSSEKAGSSPIVLPPQDSTVSWILDLVTGVNTVTLYAEDNAGNRDSTVVQFVNRDTVTPVSSFELSPRPAVDDNHLKRTYDDKIVIKGTYADAGGSGLSRVYLTVQNDSADHVNTSPVEFSALDSAFSRIITLVPGRNIIALTALDNAGNTITLRDTLLFVEPKTTATVGKKGGSIRCPDSVSITIPAHALLGATEITITRVNPINEPKPLDTAMTLLYVAHDFSPDGLVFRKPVTLRLSYTSADLDKNQDGTRDIDPENLAVVYLDGTTWRRAGESVVDTGRGTVSVEVNHFTVFDLAEDNRELPSDLKSYWVENPVRWGTGGSDFIMELPRPGKVMLRVLDMAGDLVCQVLDEKYGSAGRYPVRWKGENVTGRFAGAGLYVYVFIYTDNSGKKTVVKKPVGVIR
jgi:hypothetical protein